MRPARVGLLASCCLAGAFMSFAPDASAQQKGGGAGAGPERSSTQFTLRRQDAGVVEAQTARARARAGDCVGALPAFDAAVEKTIEPSLRRDRGLCHESLGHPYPAIEDYRAYLHASPDAADADQIRQRLAALEGQVGTDGSARPAKDKDKETPAETGDSARASFSIGTGGASASSSVSGSTSAAAAADGGHTTERGTTYDQQVAQEKLADVAEASPLRNGSGVVLGPFLHMPRFFFGERANDKLGYGVGLALRYATGPTLSLISELGYAGIGTSGEASSASGPLLLGGVELRLPLSRFAGDHILLRGGVGYERHVVSGTRAVNDNLLGRFGLGYRHVFGPSMGLEVLADGGPAYVMPENEDSRLNIVLGGSVAFLVGF
jgi:hypothetical protein